MFCNTLDFKKIQKPFLKMWTSEHSITCKSLSLLIPADKFLSRLEAIFDYFMTALSDMNLNLHKH